MDGRLTALLKKGLSLHETRSSLYCAQTRKIYTVFFVLLPILSQYRLPVVTYIDLFALATVLLMYCRGEAVRFRSSPMWGYCIWSVAITAVFSLTLTKMTAVHYFLKMLRLVFYLFTLYYGAKQVLDKTFAFRLYSAIVLLCTAIVCVQYLLYITQGWGTIVTIPLMELSYGDMTVLDLANHRQLQADFGQYRPSALFLEPAWYALYVLPWLSFAISKAKDARKKDLAVYVIVTTGLFVTGSTLSLVIVCVVWATYFAGLIKRLKFQRINKLALICAISVIALVAGIAVFTAWKDLAEKLNTLLNPTEPSSATLRLLRGLFCFAQMDPVRQLFGAGNGNLTLLFQQEGISTALDEGLQVLAYMNGMSTLLCSFGIIGLVLYLVLLMKSLKCKHNMLPVILCWLLIMISSDYYDNAFFFLFVILMQVWAETEQLQIDLHWPK